MIWFIIQLKPTRCFSKCQVSPKPKKTISGIRVSEYPIRNTSSQKNITFETKKIHRTLGPLRRWYQGYCEGEKTFPPEKRYRSRRFFFFRPKLHDFLFGAQNVSDTVTWYGSLTCLKVDAEFKPTRIHPLASWDEKGSHLMDTVRCVILSNSSCFSPQSGSFITPGFAPRNFRKKKLCFQTW